MRTLALKSHTKRLLTCTYVRTFVPASNGAEMICTALKSEARCVHVAVDERGVAGAVAYAAEADALHIFAIGSVRRGAGALLMDKVEKEARRRKLPIELVAMRDALPFYINRGYVALTDTQKSAVEMRKPCSGKSSPGRHEPRSTSTVPSQHSEPQRS